jgi:uncharacterized protein (TIGR02996 family)
MDELIHRDPEEEAAWAVYGDWLSARGDPHGELIALWRSIARGHGYGARLLELLAERFPFRAERWGVELIETKVAGDRVQGTVRLLTYQDGQLRDVKEQELWLIAESQVEPTAERIDAALAQWAARIDADALDTMMPMDLMPAVRIVSEQQRRHDEIFERHRDEWLGEVLATALRTAAEPEPRLDLAWRAGFVHAARISDRWDTPPPAIDLLAELVARPCAGFLGRLILGPWVHGSYADAVELLVRTGPHRSLRHLFIGDFSYPEECEISWSHLGDVGSLLPLLPHLETLRLRGGDLTLGRLKHDRLQRIVIESGGLPGRAVRSIGEADLPALEHLELWTGTERYGGDGDVRMLADLFDGTKLPRLRHLGLMNSELSDEIAIELASSRILPQLRSVDLALGCLSDRGGEAILARAERFAHLEELRLNHNFLSPEICARLESIGSRVLTGGQKQPYQEEGEARYYTSISE